MNPRSLSRQPAPILVRFICESAEVLEGENQHWTKAMFEHHPHLLVALVEHVFSVFAAMAKIAMDPANVAQVLEDNILPCSKFGTVISVIKNFRRQIKQDMIAGQSSLELTAPTSCSFFQQNFKVPALKSIAGHGAHSTPPPKGANKREGAPTDDNTNKNKKKKEEEERNKKGNSGQKKEPNCIIILVLSFNVKSTLQTGSTFGSVMQAWQLMSLQPHHAQRSDASREVRCCRACQRQRRLCHA